MCHPATASSTHTHGMCHPATASNTHLCYPRATRPRTSSLQHTPVLPTCHPWCVPPSCTHLRYPCATRPRTYSLQHTPVLPTCHPWCVPLSYSLQHTPVLPTCHPWSVPPSCTHLYYPRATRPRTYSLQHDGRPDVEPHAAHEHEDDEARGVRHKGLRVLTGVQDGAQQLALAAVEAGTAHHGYGLEGQGGGGGQVKEGAGWLACRRVEADTALHGHQAGRLPAHLTHSHPALCPPHNSIPLLVGAGRQAGSSVTPFGSAVPGPAPPPPPTACSPGGRQVVASHLLVPRCPRLRHNCPPKQGAARRGVRGVEQGVRHGIVRDLAHGHRLACRHKHRQHRYR